MGWSVGDRAPKSAADLAGGAERDGVAAQVDVLSAEKRALMVEGVQSPGRTWSVSQPLLRARAVSGR